MVLWPKLLAAFLICCSAEVSAQFTITENFKGSSTGNITIGGDARLTSGKEDPVGNGWLRLTPDSTNKVGYGFVNRSFPSTLGVLVDFEYTDWRRSITGLGAADGFSVFLFDAAQPNSIGGKGGSLGYAPINVAGNANNHAGVLGGYVGIGLDEYGNFSNPGEGRTGGVDANTGTLWPDRIVIRGSAAENYKYLTGAVVPGGVDYPTAGTARPDPTIFYRRVQIEIVPIVGGTNNGKYQITVRMKTALTGAFSTILGPYVMATVPPANLKLGFAGSTGGSVNNHEVRNVIITTPGGVRVDKSVDKSSAIAGQDVSYTVNVTNSTPAAIAGLKLADTIRNSNNVILTAADFTINSVTFNNNGNVGNTVPGYPNGTVVAGGTNPFNATLNMAANSTSSFTIKGTINAAYNNSILKNSVGVDPSQTGITDTDLTNNYYTVSTNVLKQSVDLAISGTVDNTCFIPGGNTYSFTVTNQGATPTVGLVTVRYTPPTGFTVVGTPAGTGWTVTLVAGVYNFTRTLADPLASGFAYPPIVIKALGPVSGGPWTNAATVLYTGDTDLNNNTASVITYANPTAPTVPATSITYCLGAPAQQLTATGTNLKWYNVAVGGTGSTTAPTPVTTTAGTTTYYVTQSNGSCEGPMTSITVVVQPALAGNTISASQTICSGTTPAQLIGGTITGGSGTYAYQWEQSPDGISWAAATGTNNQANYTPPALTSNMSYRRTVTGGSCANTSAPVTITVQAVIANNIISPPTVLSLCGSGDPGLMTGSVATGGNGTPTYQWQSSTDNSTYNNIAGVSTANYDPGIITVSTWYRRLAQSGACTVPDISNVIKFTVNLILTAGTIGANQVFCQAGTPATLTELTPATGGDQIYVYQWQSSTTSATAGFNDIAGATQATYTATTALSQTTYYRRVITAAASGCGPVTSNTVTVTINPAITGNVLNTPATTAFCGSTDPAIITGATPTGGTGSFTFTWEQSTDGGNTWTLIAGAAAASYDPPSISSTTMYRRKVVSGACSVTSNVITIRIDIAPTVANAGPNQQHCAVDLFQLSGNVPTSGTGVWAVVSGDATISNASLANATATLAKGKTATLSWTISNGTCPPSVANVMLTNYDNPSVANAGPDQIQYNSGVFTMNATAVTSGTGIWTVKPGSTASITNPASPNTSVTIAAGTTATLVWTVTNGSCVISTDEAVLTYTRIADIKVTKVVVTPGPFVAGQAITYRIVATNAGPSDATGLKILDNVPADITVSTISVSGMGTAAVTQNTSAGNAINVTADIAAGAGNIITIDVNGTVAANYSGSLVNTANVTSPVVPDPDGATATVTSPVDRKPVLVLEKDGPANVIAGDVITYKVTIKNTSSSDAIGTAIKDIIPAQIGNISWTLSKTGTATFTGNATNSGSNINFNATIPAGASNTVVINVSGIVLPSATGSFSNTATATPTESVPLVNSNTVVTTISSKSGLVMLKNAPATAQAGGPIVYTLKITNNGLSDAMNASITDVVPAEIKTVSWSATVQGAASINGSTSGSGNTISLNGNVPAGAGNAILVTINGTVDASFNGTSSNTAKASPSEPGVVPSSATATTQVSRTPVIAITKSGPATATAGQQISYTIEVTNTSLADARALVITDGIPAQLSNLSWSASTQGTASIIGTGNGTTNAISITGNLPAGSGNKIVITVTGTINAAFAGNLANTATATPAEPGTPAVSATATTQVSRTPALSILKSGPASITSGQQITYTVTVTNTGTSDAIGLSIADVVPASIKVVSWTSTLDGTASIAAGAIGSGNNVAITGDIPAGAANKITLTIRGTVDPAFNGSIVNTATATPAEPTAVPVNSSVTTAASRIPELSITKTGPANLVAGQNISYTITVSNFGSSDAKALVITDQVPANISGVTWSAVAAGTGAINGAASGAGNAITLNADLPVGSGNTITVTVTGKVASSFGGILTNSATVTPAESGALAKTATSTTTVNRIPVLSIQKTGPASIAAGQQINYTLTISNAGTADALNATITDAIPAGISGITWTAVADAAGTAAIVGTASGSTNALSFVANIPAGAANIIRVNIQGIVRSAATGNFLNTATVSPAENNALPASSSVTTTLQTIPGITLSKSGPSQIAAGQTVTYTLIAGNSGPSDATNLNITDAVPAVLTGVSWTAVAEGAAAVATGVTGSGNSVTVKGNIAAGSGNRILVTITGVVPAGSAVSSFANMATATPAEPGVPPVNSNAVTTAINKKVTVSAVKSATSVLSAGENITYTLEVKNTGPSDAQNLLIADQLPAGINGLSWTTTASGLASIISGGTGSGNGLSMRANIPAGNANVILITVTGKVDPNFSGTQLVNTFTVAPSEPGNPVVSSNTTTTLINKTADIQVQKTGPATAVAGRTINYTITVNNVGPTNAANVNIADQVPAGITGVTWNATAQNGAQINGVATGSGNSISVFAAIPSGAGTVTVNVTGTISPSYSAASLVNQVTAVPEAGVTDPSPAQSTVTTTISRVANVRIIKSGPANITAGAPITYTLRVLNDGPSFAPGVVIADVFPSTQIKNVTWTAQRISGTTISNLSTGAGNVNLTADIPARTDSILVTINGTVDPAATGMILNTATAVLPPGSLVTDPEPSSNTSSVTTTIGVETNLAVSKSGPATIDIGDRIDYTIEIKNNGISSIVNAVINDIVPNSVAVTQWSAVASNGASIEGMINGTISGTGNTIITYGDIPATLPGGNPAVILLRIQGTVKTTAQATFTNTVTVEANGVKQSAVVTAVNQSTDVYVEKSGPQAAIAGSTINYQIKVGNDGPVSVTGLGIADAVPADLKNVSWTATAFGSASITGSLTGNTNAIQTTATIAAGTANYILINVQGTIDPAITGKTMNNTATVTLPAGMTDFDLSNNSSSVQTVVTSKSGLSVRKLGPADAFAGSDITYTVIVSNAGPSNAVQTKITDAIPANLSNVSWTSTTTGTANVTAGVSGSVGADQIVALTADLPAGAGNEVHITIKGTIDANFTGPLVNNAVATPTEPNNPAVTSQNVTTTVTKKSALNIVKSGPSSVDAGTTIQYQLTASNAGPSNLVGAVINDQIPTGLTNVRWSTATTTGATVTAGATGNGNPVAITANLMAGSGTVTVTVLADIPANTALTGLQNTATVTPAVPDANNPPATSNPVNTNIVKNVNLTLTKSGPPTLNAGESITYTLAFKNTGPSDALASRLTDAIPAEIKDVTWTSSTTGSALVNTGSTGSGNSLDLTADVPVNGTILVNIKGTVDPLFVGTLTNTAVLTPQEPGESPINAVAVTQVKKLTNLQIGKSGVANAIAGQIMTYQIKVSNAGPSTALNALITDAIPAQLESVSWTATAAGTSLITEGAYGTGNTLQVKANIPVGQQNEVTIQVTGKIAASFAGTLNNTATVTSADPDNPAVVTPPVTTVVAQKPQVILSKTGPTSVVAGGQIIYTIEANNTGLSDATNLVIADAIPQEISNVSWTTTTAGTAIVNSGNIGSGNALQLNGNIPTGVNNKITITVKGTVDPAFAGTLSNMATATPSEAGNPVVNSPVVQTTVTQVPVIVVNKTGPASATAGGSISYVIELSNTGLSNAKNLAITDQIDPAIKNASWTAAIGGNSSINGAASGNGNVALNVNIPAGSGNKINVTITGTIDPAASGKLTNIATATPAEPGNPPVNSNPVETNIDQKPIVKITKVGQATATAGAEITYTIEAINTGLSNANGVSIVDDIPVQLNNPSWVAVAGGTANIVSGATGTTKVLLVTANIPAGNANNKITITLKGTVNPGFSGNIENTASIAVPLINFPNVVTPPVETAVDSKPGIVLTKTGPASAIAGSEVEYTIVAGNTGLSDAKALILSDNVSALLSNVSWTSSVNGSALVNSGGTGTGNALSLNVDIPAGAGNVVTVKVKGTIAPGYNGNLTNSAVATPSEPGTVPVNANTTMVVSRIPVLAIAKSGPAVIAAGKEIIYTLNIINNGTSNAENATVTDAIPADISNVSWTTTVQGTAAVLSGATGSTNNLSLNVNVPAGAGNSVLVTVKGTVSPAATANLVNKATVTPSEPESLAASSTVTTTIKSESAVSLVKSGPTQISAGQMVTYTLIAGNNGPSDAVDLNITDVVPATLTGVSWLASATGTASLMTGITGSGNNVQVKGNIPAGSANQIQITITGNIPASASAGVLSNTATATPSEPGNPLVTSNTVTTIVSRIVNIRAVKSAPTTVAAGESINYNLQVYNDGPGDAMNLAIKDLIPAGINNISWTTSATGGASIVSNGNGTGATVNPIVNIPAGTGNAVNVLITGDVDPGFTGSSIKNSFTASPSEPGNPPVTSPEVTTGVVKTADIQIQKTGPSTVVAGSAISYTILVTNAGPSNAAAVNILDNLPAGFTAASWSAVAQNGAVINGPASGSGNLNMNAAIPAGSASVQIIINGKVAADYTGTSLINTATATPEAGITDPSPATSTVTTAITRTANVRITKSGPANISVGETMSYKLRLVNDGPSDAIGLLIKDLIPANLEANASWTATTQNGAVVSQPNGLGDINITGSIPAGTGLIEIDIIGKVKANNADQSLFSNTATAYFPAGSPINDPDLSSNSSTVSTIVNNDPVLKVSKSGPATVNIGDPIEYNIVVRNGGAGNIVNAMIADPVPADVTVSSWSAVATGGATLNGTSAGLTNSISTVADIPADGDPNTAVTIRVIGTVATTANAMFTNTVTVTANGERKSSVVTAVNQSTDIKIEKSGPQAVISGGAISYTIKTTNQGPREVTGLTISDNIPATIGQISWTAQANGAATLAGPATGNTNVLLTSANIPVGAQNYILLTVNGTVDPGTPSGTMSNVASVTMPAGISDFNLSNNTSEVKTAISSVSGLTISKAGPQDGVSGSNITYTIKVRNNGLSNAVQAQIKDVVPAGINAVSWTAIATGAASINSGATGTGNTILVSANIPSGISPEITIVIQGTIDPGFSGQLLNAATVTPAEPGNPMVTSPAVTTTVVNKSAVQILKSGPTSVEAGKTINYTLSISNTGPGNAMNVAIADVIPVELTAVSWTSKVSGGATINTGASGQGNALAMDVNLPAGNGLITVNITGLVPANTTAANLSNTATAKPTEPGNPLVSSNTITTAVVNNASLSLTKSGPGAIRSGEAISYTLTIANTGPSDAVGVKVSDIVPATVTGVSWTTTLSGGANVTAGSTGNVNQVNLTTNIPAGGGIVVNIIGKVDPTYSGVLLNKASLIPADPSKPAITSEVSTAVTNASNLRITKTGGSTALAGSVMTYQIRVSNTGPSTAQNAVITDAIPAGLTGVTWSTSATGAASISNGQSGSGNTLSVRATIPAGAADVVVIDITGTVKADFAGSLSNTATITPAEPGNPAVTTPPVTTVVSAKPTLLISKTGPSTANAGTAIAYTIKVSNSGPSNALAAVIKDAIPAEITAASWTATATGSATVTSGATGSGNTLSVTANIPAGTGNEITITVNGTVDPAFVGTLSNTANVTPTEPGTTPVSSVTVSTVVTNKSGVTMVKHGPATLNSGETITYTIAVGNAGPSNAVGLKLKDAVPAQITGISWSSTQTGGAVISNGGTGTGNTVDMTANVPVGATILVTITGKVDPAFIGTLSNQAVLTPPDPAKPVITSSVNTVVSNRSGLKITKTGLAAATAGKVMTYQIKVSNTGPGTAQNAVITDLIPTDLGSVSWTAETAGNATITAGKTGTGNNLSVTATIPPGAADLITINITGTINPAMSGNLSNTATVTPAEPGNPAVVTPPVETVVTRMPAVVLVKTAPVTLKSGALITYTIEVTNGGSSDAKGLTIADMIASDISNVKWATETTGAAKVLTGGIGNSNNLNMTVDLPAGPANKITITITGTVARTFVGRILNTARAVSSEGAPEVSSNTVETMVDVADFIIPNIITPNNDGNNDTFKIKGLENYPGTEVLIFNRWGNEVYRSANYKNDWDGSQLNEGTYYYIINRKEKTGNATTFKGWLFLKR